MNIGKQLNNMKILMNVLLNQKLLKQSIYLQALLLCIGLLAGANALAQGRAQGRSGPPVALVAISEAVETSLAPITSVAGTVISQLDSRIAAEQEGRVLDILDVGSAVKQGDVLVRIDAGPLSLRVVELAAEVERTKARLAFLKSEYERQQELADRKLTSTTSLEQTRSDQNVAVSEVAVAQSRLDQAKADLERSEIRAPFDGMVIERMVQIGERVSVGMVAVRLADPHSLEIVARPPLNYFSFVNIGQGIEVSSSNGSEFWPVRTKVSLGNENTHVFEMRLDVESDLYASGQTVRVGVPIAATEQVIAVPRDALVLRGSGTTIFVLQEDMTVRQEPVVTGVGDNELIGIQGNIHPGDKVIIRGNERLRPGQNVELLGV